MQERPDLEELRSAIVIGTAQMKQELKEIQDRILYKLSTSEGSPLDDLDFIVTLEASKVKSDDIKVKEKFRNLFHLLTYDIYMLYNLIVLWRAIVSSILILFRTKWKQLKLRRLT